MSNITFEPKIKLSWKTNGCYVCGSDNAVGMHIPFVRDGERGSRAEYIASADHCGWPGVLHGGVAFSLMDEALAYALYFQGLYGVTAKTDTRFRRPVSVGTKLVIRAWTVEQRRRLVTARAEMRVGSDDGELAAECLATMYLQELDTDDAPRP